MTSATIPGGPADELLELVELDELVELLKLDELDEMDELLELEVLPPFPPEPPHATTPAHISAAPSHASALRVFARPAEEYLTVTPSLFFLGMSPTPADERCIVKA